MLANKARRTLITIGKAIPFALCFIVCFSYLETLYAICFERYLYFWDCTILNTPISFFIGNYFEYDFGVIIVAMIISIAIETCKWNKIAILYLALNLFQKSYVDSVELDELTIYFICIGNILICSSLIYKGIKNMIC